MEGIGLKYTPVVVRHLLGPLNMFGLMADTSSPNIYSRGFNLPLTTYPLIRSTCDITVVMKKFLKIQQCYS